MSFVIHDDKAPVRIDSHGDVRVGASRVLLDSVIHAFRDGETPESIAQDYDTLPLADIYAVIAYYLRHVSEVDDYLLQREDDGRELQKQVVAQQGDMQGIRERLLARRTKPEASHAATG